MVLNHGNIKLHGIIPVWVTEKLYVTEGLSLEYQCLGQAVEGCHMNVEMRSESTQGP